MIARSRHLAAHIRAYRQVISAPHAIQNAGAKGPRARTRPRVPHHYFLWVAMLWLVIVIPVYVAGVVTFGVPRVSLRWIWFVLFALWSFTVISYIPVPRPRTRRGTWGFAMRTIALLCYLTLFWAT